MTPYHETPAGLLVSRAAELREGSGTIAQLSLMESMIRQLELELHEQGWQRLGEGSGREFSRQTIDEAIELSRAMYLRNPLIHRAVEVGSLYTWGQELSVKAADAVKPVIDRFDRDNDATLTGQQASRLLDVEWRVTGNVFLAFFTNTLTGAIKVRQVPVEQIRGIVTSPDDHREIWYFHRVWNEISQTDGATTKREAFYPHLDYRPDDRPDRFRTPAGELEVRWNAPIDHVKSGSFLHWLWGLPKLFSGFSWSRAYTGQLEDDATRSRALAKFAWKVTTGGGSASVAAGKTLFGTTLGQSTGETNPVPAAGAAFVRGSAGQDLDPIRISGAMLDADHSRPARLMVAAAAGLPDTTLSGDVDQSSLATSQSMDRPTHLQFSEDRKLWTQQRARWYRYAIEQDIAAGPSGLLRGTRPTNDELRVECTFPDLLEPDVTKTIGSITAAASYISDELASRLVMSALGVEDIDGELAKLAKEQAAKPVPQPPVPSQQPPPPGSMREARRKLDAAAIERAKQAWDDVVPATYKGLVDADVTGDEAAP